MSPTEFIAALRKGKTASVYFLRGPDRFLHEACREALVNSVPEGAREWSLAKIEFEPGHLARELQAADQIPMLGGRSYFLFSDPNDFKHSTESDYEALESYLERPSPFAVVVFIAGEPDRRRRFVQLLEKEAETVEMRPLGVRQAAAWAEHFLRNAGVEIDPELAEEIAEKFESTSDREPERAGVNLLRMRTELEKLLTAKPGAKRLELEDLDVMVAFRDERQISTLLRAIAERNCDEALERLRALLSSKTAETLLLWSVSDLLRQALKAQSTPPMAGRGSSSYGSYAPYGAGRGGGSRPGNPASTWEIAARMLRKYTRPELTRALRLARRADLGIKSSWKDSRILLEFLIWEIIAGKGSGGVADWSGEMSALAAEG